MKLKITLALVLLFGLLVLVSILGILRINTLANDAREILKDNYVSLEYVQRMNRALDNWAVDSVSRDLFAENLQKQQLNVTETGEQDATDAITRYFDVLKKNPSDALALRALRENLLTVADVNLEAIARKNDQVGRTAERSVALLSTIATFCILIGFSFLLNFPGYLANPIRDLTAGIREIARGNYSQRLRLDRKDELGELAEAFNQMAIQLDAYEHSNLARLLFEKKRLETIIEAMHDPVVGLDENQYVLFANTQALRLLNLPAEKLIGKDAREVALTNDLLRALLAQGVQGQASGEPEPLKIFAQGKESFFQPEYLPIAVGQAKDSPPLAVGHVYLLKNITPFRERDVAKTNFIATVSHELKTPISAIKVSLRLLDDPRVGALNDEQRQLLHQIGEDAGRLLNITGELLDLTQAETGNLRFNLAPTPPEAILQPALEAVQSLAEAKQVRVELSLPDQLPAVQADGDKTVWVLINLLNNAIRFSPGNTVVRVEARVQDQFVEFSVSDQGPGIDPRYRDRIFDRYFRAPGSASSGGTGLGLAICREFIEAQGGCIGVESTGSNGSRFWFQAPSAKMA